MNIDDLVRAHRSLAIRAGSTYLEKEAIDPQHLRDLLIGGGIGAAGGAVVGAASGKEHRIRRALLGGVLGGGLGAGTAELLRRSYLEDQLRGAQASANRINKAIAEENPDLLGENLDEVTGAPKELFAPGVSSGVGAGAGALAGAGIGAATAKEKKDRLRRALLGGLAGGGLGFVSGGAVGEAATRKGWNTVTEGFNDLDPSLGPLTGVSVGRIP